MTRSQLLKHYNETEKASPITDALIEAKTANQQFQRHPEVPNCIEARLYWCKAELSRDNQDWPEWPGPAAMDFLRKMLSKMRP
eukprot:568792-Alexandrium_andersonii.AAC.1